MTSSSVRFVIAALSIATLLWTISHIHQSPTDLDTTQSHFWSQDKRPTRSQILPKPHYLRNLNETIGISTLVVQAKYATAELDLIEHLNFDLPHLIDADESTLTEPIDLGVPKHVKVPPRVPFLDASSILFGVATTIDRLDDSLDAFSHWASNTGARIISIVLPEDINSPTSSSVATVIDKAARLNISLAILQSNYGYIERYVGLLKALEEQVTPDTRWVAIIDDDTFFPSMSRLTSMLNSYDSHKEHYIGGLTERVEAVAEWGYLAYGGAGVFLSVPLLQKIYPHLNDCQHMAIVSGDGKLAECIYSYSTTKLTLERGLNQLDMIGDYSGFFEAVRSLPISLHHWKSWGHHDMLKISAISTITGDEAIFQKYKLADGWWMTNGFSIVKYSDEIGTGTLPHSEGSMEHTFGSVQEESQKTFMHSLQPLRPRDEAKVQFLLEEAVQEDDDAMTLYYVRREEGIAVEIVRTIWLRP